MSKWSHYLESRRVAETAGPREGIGRGGGSSANEKANDDRGVDCLVLTTTRREADAMGAMLRLAGGGGAAPLGLLSVGRRQVASGQDVEIALCKIPEQGITHAAVTATRFSMLLRPQLVVLAGTCMGYPSDVSIGDVVIAKAVSNHDAGKRRVSAHEPESHAIALPPKSRDAVDRVCSSCDHSAVYDEALRACGAKGDEQLVDRSEFRVRDGLAMTCGSALVIDNGLTISKARAASRKVAALDMESYAVACACSLFDESDWVVCKGVLDFGIDESEPDRDFFNDNKIDINQLPPKNDSCYKFASSAAMVVAKMLIDSYTWE